MPSNFGSGGSLTDRPLRVFFPCTGLGRQRRGFETFTVECANALSADARLQISVFSGARTREAPTEALFNLPRDSRAAEWLAHLHGRGPYFSEQLSFFLSLVPHLVVGRPHVLYFADLNLGNLCWHWRRATGQRFRMLYYNGGMTTMPFTRTDWVQQVTPMGLDEATARGESAARQIMLPHGVRVPRHLPMRATPSEKEALGIPADRQVVLAVGLLDASIKRMDYLIREIALMETRPFLVLLGAETDETPAVRALATQLLGEGNFLIRTVTPHEVAAHYQAADAFVLGSLREGFGLAYVEALAHGLPIVAHDFPVTQYLLGSHAWLNDLTIEGGIAKSLAGIMKAPLGEKERAERHASARDRFSWEVLREEYVSMLLRVGTESV